MEERNIELDIRRWLDLSKSGKAKEAKDFYSSFGFRLQAV